MTSFNNLIEITDKLDSLLSLIGHHSTDLETKNCIGVAWDFNYDLRTKLFKLKSEFVTTETLISATRALRHTPHDSGMSIGDRIQLARENLDLTEADLARNLNTYSDHISDWECGTTEVPANLILPLSEALKCDPLWLLGDFDGTKPPSLIQSAQTPTEIMPDVDTANIGKRIRERRVAQRLYVEELENIISAPEGSVSCWEMGKTVPASQYIDKLAIALGTGVTWLLTGREITGEL